MADRVCLSPEIRNGSLGDSRQRTVLAIFLDTATASSWRGVVLPPSSDSRLTGSPPDLVSRTHDRQWPQAAVLRDDLSAYRGGRRSVGGDQGRYGESGKLAAILKRVVDALDSRRDESLGAERLSEVRHGRVQAVSNQVQLLYSHASICQGLQQQSGESAIELRLRAVWCVTHHLVGDLPQD